MREHSGEIFYTVVMTVVHFNKFFVVLSKILLFGVSYHLENDLMLFKCLGCYRVTTENDRK